MFAVPGWSVSASALKTQLDSKVDQPGRDSKSFEGEKKSRKRKRGHGSGKGAEVTEENLGDLWKKHIEVESLHQSDDRIEGNIKRDKKTRKSVEDSAVSSALEGDPGANGDLTEGFVEEGGTTTSQLDNVPAGIKKKKKQKRQSQEQGTVAQANDYVPNAGGPPNFIESPSGLEGSKAKFEQRKAKAAKKREAKALLQANGTLPPTRPEAMASIGKVPQPKPIHPPNPSECSKPPEIQQESPFATREDPPKTTDLLKSAREPQSSDPFLSNTQLTPLQQRMTAKLMSSRFRHLNEVLYTSPSDQAMRLFTESPQNYTSYHAGFRAQVAVWPQNPVDGLIEDVKIRGKVSVPSQKKMWRDQKKGQKPRESNSNDGAATNGEIVGKVDPLPRTRGTCTIADLGCGDAHLAASLHTLRTSLNLNLLSFDLAKVDTPNAHLITVADISNLLFVGIKDSSVDIAICCLSLMNTNWVSVVDECSRIVRGGGEAWIAEIKSRFARPGQIGKKKGDGIGKKKKAKVEDEDESDLLAVDEIEEAKGPKDETDVSAFVEVFRKRGFNLKGEPDMANKMFVRMRFTKGLRPENEKGGAAKFGDGFRGKQVKTKFLEDEERVVDESKVLKPCVYKIR